MSYSIQRVVSDGTLALLDIEIKYLYRDEIAVLFDDVVNALPWAWVGEDEKKLSFSPAVPNGVEVAVKRTTDISKPLHVFSQGAQFTDQSLDENITQVLHIAQEAKEGSGLGEVYQDLNFHGYRAINMGNGSDPGDAVNHAQMQVHDAKILGYKDAAAASAAEAEYWAGVAEDATDLSALLRKDDNLASLTDKPAARSNLGLGTAATATLGTSAGQIPTADQISGLGVPAGAVMYFAMSSAPTGWLKANGALVSRTTYSALFAAIGTTFGAGDGATTFTLPDLRGEFIRGWDNGRGVDSGRSFGTVQGGEIQSHNHARNTFGVPEYIRTDTGDLPGTYAVGATVIRLSSETGMSGGAETRPRNIALLACIKY